MKIGDLVKYKFDFASEKIYLIATLDPIGCEDKRGNRFATLHEWDELNAAGTVQRFRLDSLEIISYAQ
jgi:hypothetical protein